MNLTVLTTVYSKQPTEFIRNTTTFIELEKTANDCTIFPLFINSVTEDKLVVRF